MIFSKEKLEKAGLRDFEVEALVRLMRAYPEVEKMVLFGSRAKGRFTHSSDIDLAIYGEALNKDLMAEIRAVLTGGLPFPRPVDVVNPGQPWLENLGHHIERDGILIYERDAEPGQ